VERRHRPGELFQRQLDALIQRRDRINVHRKPAVNHQVGYVVLPVFYGADEVVGAPFGSPGAGGAQNVFEVGSPITRSVVTVDQGDGRLADAAITGGVRRESVARRKPRLTVAILRPRWSGRLGGSLALPVNGVPRPGGRECGRRSRQSEPAPSKAPIIRLRGGGGLISFRGAFEAAGRPGPGGIPRFSVGW
jgi:hypothetical protein